MKIYKTRMHFTRMRTVRLIGHLYAGVCPCVCVCVCVCVCMCVCVCVCLGVSAWGMCPGCVCRGEGHLSRGVCPGGCLPRGGVSVFGFRGCLPLDRGVGGVGGVCLCVQDMSASRSRGCTPQPHADTPR